MNKKITKTVLILLVLLIFGVTYGCGRLEGIDDSDNAESAETADDLSDQIDESTTVGFIQNSSTEKALFFVHVCGCVVNPDVYACEPGSRITDAVKLAGGFLDDAESDYLNLAEPVTDGMKIYVPSAEEIQNATGGSGSVFFGGTFSENTVSGSSENGKININTASREELMTLSGVGEIRAQSIIDYRTTNGSFQRIEDIMNVSGIKEAFFQKIRDHISV